MAIRYKTSSKKLNKAISCLLAAGYTLQAPKGVK